MNKFIMLLCSHFLLLVAAQALAASPNAQSILSASDAIRNPDQPFGLTSTLIEYRNGKQIDTSTLAIYARADKQSGQFRNLIRFVAPQRDAGKLMLKNGNDLWFFDPANKASIRISPQQRLLGQAANGDVMTVNLAVDYHAQLASEEEIQDGEKKTRAAYLLTLTAKNPEVTYHRIDYWVDRLSFRPIKAKFYSASDRLLKTAYYRKFDQQLGQERPTETVIIDGLDPQWVTVLRSSDFAFRDVPESWLQRDFLPRFKAE
ncbi:MULTISPECIES: outer membrane lipoprotein-sorting protein [Deefgea]|uniref:Outer membrane lipoprotein-sorting protein n=1 Tax=Deefgea chitinilytica TaxID=570276 RepID=A0ABS2C9X8_9NEIS|nr:MULTISPECIES: outer membrane lipoprotein-sorting protein [Deefgea]MBM5570935.1 outer membrane lipoprotein-sorting protein [Deefgea chitinilytica]MBM9888165.1 outer membrane lipoprotein-sorting protein [Deefgea sp. CFH1-16]